jgi:hypothetical protein
VRSRIVALSTPSAWGHSGSPQQSAASHLPSTDGGDRSRPPPAIPTPLGGTGMRCAAFRSGWIERGSGRFLGAVTRRERRCKASEEGARLTTRVGRSRRAWGEVRRMADRSGFKP